MILSQNRFCNEIVKTLSEHPEIKTVRVYEDGAVFFDSRLISRTYPEEEVTEARSSHWAINSYLRGLEYARTWKKTILSQYTIGGSMSSCGLPLADFGHEPITFDEKNLILDWLGKHTELGLEKKVVVFDKRFDCLYTESHNGGKYTVENTVILTPGSKYEQSSPVIAKAVLDDILMRS